MRLDQFFRTPFGGVMLGEWLAVLVLVLANGAVFYHFFENLPAPLQGRPPYEKPEIIARTMGHIVCLNFAVLIVLPQRNSIWILFVGTSQERMIKYHRIMGRVLFAAVTIHLAMFWYHWISTHTVLSARHGLPYPLMTPSIIGHAAWICIFVILITSLETIRRSKFELFYYTHHLFLAVVGLAIYHTYLTQKWSQDMLLYWLSPGILMYIFDLIIRSLRARGKTQLVSVVRDEETDIMLIRMRKKNFRFEPGQYVYINFPQVSKLEWHPFSITSAPSESTTRDTIVSVAIRDMGSRTWSGQLHKMFDRGLLPENIEVRLEGPYGNLSIELFEYPILVLVAGGIGVAPLISILTEYNNNPSLVFEKLYFLWCAKHEDFLVPFSHILQNLESNDMLGKMEIHRYATRSVEAQRRITVNNGPQQRLSFSGLMGGDSSQRGLSLNNDHVSPRVTNSIPLQFTPGRPLLQDFFGRVVARHSNSSRIGVVVCGPKLMADDVEKACSQLRTRKGPRIDLHRESFEL